MQMTYKIKQPKEKMQSANYYATTPEDKKIEKEMNQENSFAEDTQEKPEQSKSYTMEQENHEIDQLIGNTDTYEEDEADDDDESFLEEDEHWGIEPETKQEDKMIKSHFGKNFEREN
jgi:hypothetical protein